MTNESFSEFVGQYEKLVFTVCFQMVRDYQEAQNLAQETFLAAYRSIDRCQKELSAEQLAELVDVTQPEPDEEGTV